jgi:hypothetical protein
MDRNFVYPGSIPLDTDLLSINRSAMVALGYLAQAALGQGTVADGLACMPTSPASLAVTVGPGSVTQFSVIDAQAYGSLPADPTAPLVKMGINTSATSFTLAAPTTPGQTVAYLIQASLQESDVLPVVLPYYNASDPSQPFSGPANAGTSQNTERIQRAQLELKAGAPASAGAQALPPVDNGWVGLYMVTVSYGQSAVTAANISVLPAAPFIAFKLPSLRPGFASGVQSFYASVPFTVPAGVTQVEVELWGGGSGSFASASGVPSGGGSGGGYARKRVTGLQPGQTVFVSVGPGGTAGTAALAPGGGGTSSFGPYVSATGGALAASSSLAAPQSGATPAGSGVGGDLNATGSAGQAGLLATGGIGGAAPLGGAQTSVSVGALGAFPGGGASGAGTQGSATFNGAQGANGFVIVRW